MTDRTALGSLGQVHVTRAATLAYAKWAGLEPEAARKALTRLLLQATLRQEQDGDRPASFRYRSRAEGVDLSARVIREGDDMLTVVAVSVRDY